MPAREIYQLFVYGSLRSGFQSQAYEYVSRYFSFVAEAKVKGKIYDMGSYAAGVPTDEEAFITGELYKVKEIDEFSWAMGQLDDYEGVSVEPDEVQLFRREIVDVYYDNQDTQAWIYWYNGSTIGRPLIASGDMLQYLQQKKKSFG
jgi:gamma-glutamylcyclotransferase (GGCT)/AIG2-like uncharacterized protein YtfP